MFTARGRRLHPAIAVVPVAEHLMTASPPCLCHSDPGPAGRDHGRLLAYAVGAQLDHHRDADQAEGDGTRQVPPVLAQRQVGSVSGPREWIAMRLHGPFMGQEWSYDFLHWIGHCPGTARFKNASP